MGSLCRRRMWQVGQELDGCCGSGSMLFIGIDNAANNLWDIANNSRTSYIEIRDMMSQGDGFSVSRYWNIEIVIFIWISNRARIKLFESHSPWWSAYVRGLGVSWLGLEVYKFPLFTLLWIFLHLYPLASFFLKFHILRRTLNWYWKKCRAS